MSATDPAIPALIVPRRNFLIRALGFTAAGVAMPVPVIAMADAKARMDHHEAELKKAWQDYYGPSQNVRWSNDTCPVGTISPATVERERQFDAHYRTSIFYIIAGGGPICT